MSIEETEEDGTERKTLKCYEIDPQQNNLHYLGDGGDADNEEMNEKYLNSLKLKDVIKDVNDDDEF